MTYHFKSAADINDDILNDVKAAFKEKSIIITIEEEMDETAFLMNSVENKVMLLRSVSQYKNGESVSMTISDNE